MGLYRTKPEEVEAIRYTGNTMTPFDGDVPQWVWAGLGTGVLKFSAHGLEITYSGMSETVLANDWMVMHNDGIIRACEDKVFKTHYVRARKRIADRLNDETEAA
jgi:hypothetical protein